MRISLIGMSGSGKSYWSSKLAEQGFERFCCDELIADRLSVKLRRPDGKSLTLGEWMGLPFEPHYKEREAEYLATEIRVLTDVIHELARRPRVDGERIVVDTTGSAIYTGEEVLEALWSLTTVVHFPVPPAVQHEMLAAYVAKPRPILWRDLFAVAPGETNDAALARCYARLLVEREARYERHADVRVEYQLQKSAGFGVDDLLDLVRSWEASELRQPTPAPRVRN
ncbi:MAG: hypothetical protein HY900_30850 [Deltaproteobacteria bacterium]|nr:hypothetical protein [Deltaproteobacteria bacterium]